MDQILFSIPRWLKVNCGFMTATELEDECFQPWNALIGHELQSNACNEVT
jgi:hypothetical protein